MKFEVKTYNWEHPKYLRDMDKYEIALDKYHDEVYAIQEEDEDDEDDVLKTIFNEQKEEEVVVLKAPKHPLPPATYQSMNVRDKIVLSYSTLPNDEVRIFLDYTLMEQNTFLIKFDEKIIKELDEILK
jgi:hypothetical protein